MFTDKWNQVSDLEQQLIAAKKELIQLAHDEGEIIYQGPAWEAPEEFEEDVKYCLDEVDSGPGWGDGDIEIIKVDENHYLFDGDNLFLFSVLS